MHVWPASLQQDLSCLSIGMVVALWNDEEVNSLGPHGSFRARNASAISQKKDKHAHACPLRAQLADCKKYTGSAFLLCLHQVGNHVPQTLTFLRMTDGQRVPL